MLAWCQRAAVPHGGPCRPPPQGSVPRAGGYGHRGGAGRAGGGQGLGRERGFSRGSCCAGGRLTRVQTPSSPRFARETAESSTRPRAARCWGGAMVRSASWCRRSLPDPSGGFLPRPKVLCASAKKRSWSHRRGHRVRSHRPGCRSALMSVHPITPLAPGTGQMWVGERWHQTDATLRKRARGCHL